MEISPETDTSAIAEKIANEIRQRLDEWALKTITNCGPPEPESFWRVMADGTYHSCNKYCNCQRPKMGGWAGLFNLDCVT